MSKLCIVILSCVIITACASTAPYGSSSVRRPANTQPSALNETGLPASEVPIGSFIHVSGVGPSISKLYGCYEVAQTQILPVDLQAIKITGHVLPAGNTDYPNNFIASMWDVGVAGQMGVSEARECPKIRTQPKQWSLGPKLIKAQAIVESKRTGVRCVYESQKSGVDAMVCEFTVPKPAVFKDE